MIWKKAVIIHYIKEKYLIFTLLTISLILKFILSRVLTVHGDEGMYVYDASLILEGLKPHVDYHTRSPAYLYILAAFLALFGKSIFIGRLCSIIASTITSILIYKIGKLLYSEKVGLFSFILFSFSPFTLMWSVIIATEVIQLMFITLSIYLILLALHQNKGILWFVVCGLFLGLSLFVRRTSIVILICEIIIVFLYYSVNTKNTVNAIMKKCAKNTIFLISGVLLIFIPIFLSIVIGRDLDYAISSFLSNAGWGSSGKGDKSQVFQELVEHAYYLIVLVAVYILFSLKLILERSVKKDISSYSSTTVFFGIALFSLMVLRDITIILTLFLFMLLIFFSQRIVSAILPDTKNTIEKSFTQKPDETILFFGLFVIAFLIILKPNLSVQDFQSLVLIFIFVILILFFKTKIGKKHDLMVLSLFYLVFPFVFSFNKGFKDIVLLAVISLTIFILFYLFVKKFEVFSRTPLFSNLSILIWFMSVFVFYLYYSMSQELFYYEISAVACIMAGVVLKELHEFKGQRGLVKKLLFSLIILSLITSPFYYLEEEQKTTITKPWTVYEVANYIREHTDENEEIFTANMAIAIEANRPIVMNLSHPTIYCKDYVSGFPDFSVIDYPTPEGIIKYLDEKQVRFVVNDPLTNYYYLLYNDCLRVYIKRNYILVKEINHVKILERSKEGDYRVSSSLTDAVRPFIETNGKGNLIFGYVCGELQKQNVFYKTITNDGISSEIRVTPTTQSFSHKPQGYIDNEENIYLVWSENTSTYSNIFFSKLDKNGTSIISPMAITSSVDMGTYAKSPQILMDSQDNIYIIWSWAPEREGYYDLYYIVLNKNGTKQTNPIPLTNDLADNFNPSLAIDNRDNIHLVWQDGREGKYQTFYGKLRYNSNESQLVFVVNPQRISSLNDEALNPDISLADEKIHIVWQNSEELYGRREKTIHYAQIDINGTIFIPEKTLTYRYVSEEHEKNGLRVLTKNPAVASKNGLTVVVWQDNRWEGISDEVFWNVYQERKDYENRYWNIYYKILDEDGNVFKNDTLVTYYESNSITPDIVFNENSFHVVWADDITENYQILHKEIEVK